MANPDIRNIDTPEDFDQLAMSMGILLGDVNSLDYDDLLHELAGLSVEMSDSPSLQLLSSQIQRIQVAKDRATFILQQATRNYFLHKRVSDILSKGWCKFSDGKSQDKWEADASLKLGTKSALAMDSLISVTSPVSGSS